MTLARGLLIACLLGACALARRPPPAPPRQTSLGLTISTHTLANGLRVVLVKDPHASDVQITMRYQVGAVDDLEHPGMAHFVEHLMFQQLLDAQPLFTHLEDTATYFNAMTTYDATTFIERARTDQLDKLLAIEATRVSARCSTITESAFAREREVVINEVKMRDQATEVFGAIHSVLYPAGHPYRQAIAGSVDSVGEITLDQACRFIDAYYAPTNAVLVISGNASDLQVQTALAKLVSRVAKRVAAVPTPVAPVMLHPLHVEVPAPLDEDVLVLAWPLPVQPAIQAKVRAIASILPRLVDAKIKGQVAGIEFGDWRAPMYGLVVLPGDDETFLDAVNGTRLGIGELPEVFTGELEALDQIVFDRVQQGAIYNVYSSLEDGSDRDVRLASFVLAGLDPSEALAAELDGLRGLTREEGQRIAVQYLNANSPTVVTLKASAGKKRGKKLALRAPVHDMGQRRTPPDPALARRPADGAATRDAVGVKTRVLANGLTVVLLPLTSVPTIDMRLIFHSGTADEPIAKRGVAMLAAHTLTWDMHYLNDLMLFVGAGGMHATDVSTDRTTFSAQGVDTHLDVLLAGLRRWIREGTFDDDAQSLVLALRRAAKQSDDDGQLTDVWRAALFGIDHPYVRAGLARHTNTTLSLDDAARFRATHYTPDNATLVIAGRFDPVLADRWIDYLFADWQGHAQARKAARIAPQPASIAKIDDLALLQLRIALPADAAKRAQALVAAEMLAEIAGDVRHELGATYTLDAQLAESRLASFYVIAGFVDAARSTAALQLIRDRIQKLRSSGDTAARAFVIARNHVLTKLISRVGSAGSLADRAEHDVEMQREPMSDLHAAAAVQALTIDGMAGTLGELDLAHAAVLMRGPSADLKNAFDVLGRKPTYVQADPAKREVAAASPPGATAPIGASSSQHVRMSDVATALTEQPPPRLVFSVMPGYSLAQTDAELITGLTLSGTLGYRFSPGFAVGGHLGAGSLRTGSDSTGQTRPGWLVPIEAAAMLHFDFVGRAWLDTFLGLHISVSSTATPTADLGIGFGGTLGVDVFRIGSQHFGIAGRIVNTQLSAHGYGELTLGLFYRQ